MQYIQNSKKSVTQVVENIKQIAPTHKFGVLSVRDMKETLESKGFPIDRECVIIDICNPGIANTLLTKDPFLSSILPCKMSVCSHDSETIVVMSSLTQLIDDINPDFIDLATKTQETLQTIISEAI